MPGLLLWPCRTWGRKGEGRGTSPVSALPLQSRPPGGPQPAGTVAAGLVLAQTQLGSAWVYSSRRNGILRPERGRRHPHSGQHLHLHGWHAARITPEPAWTAAAAEVFVQPLRVGRVGPPLCRQARGAPQRARAEQEQRAGQGGHPISVFMLEAVGWAESERF